MKIDKSKTKLVFEFSPEGYWLCKEDEQITCWPYSLRFKIDRTYKDKGPDVGIAKIYLDEKETQIARDNGFEEIIIS